MLTKFGGIPVVETFVQSTDDVVKFLKGQHDLIKDMFEEVFSASDPKAREKAFVELRQLLAVHETAEEMVVHRVRATKSLTATRSSTPDCTRSTRPSSSCPRSRAWTSTPRSFVTS